MKERGRSGGNGRMGRRQFSKMGACVCLKCGYRQNHAQGSPCRMMSCPRCGTPLMNEAVVGGKVSETTRSNKQTQKADVETEVQEKKGAEVTFPRVDAALCKGCGICVDVCPQHAIRLQDGIAFIDEDRCKNCRICVRKCPTGAIS